MLSTVPYATARQGGCLLCVWLPSYAHAIRARRSLFGLMGSIACGCETWGERPAALLMVWCPARLSELVTLALAPAGSVIDWPGVLPIEGEWVTFFGQPHLLGAQESVAIATANVPDWLARLQAEAAS